MKASVTFQIGDWTHSMIIESSKNPEEFVRNFLRPETILTDVLDKRFGASPSLAIELDEIARSAHGV